MLDLRIPADNAQSTTAAQLTIILGLGLLGGLAVGVVVAALLVVLDPRVRTTEDVRRSSGLPVVGQLPSSLRRMRRGKPFARDLADAFRGFVVDLRLLAGGIDPPFLVLVPTSPRDRSDLVRLGLARTLSLSGLSVAVVAVDPADPLAPPRAPPPVADGEHDGEEDAEEEEPEVAESEEEEEAPAPEPGAFARAAAGVRSGVLTAAQWIRSRFSRAPHPVPGEPFTVTVAEDLAASAREREAVLVALANEAALESDTVVLVAREGEEFPALSRLVGAAVIIVADSRVTRRTRLRSISTALEFAGVKAAGVVMTSVPARRRDDLPSTWFEGDRIVRAERRAGVRPRRSGPKPTPSGGGKASGAGKSEPAGRPGPTDLTLDFGEPEAIAG
jgi:hypothetical protein